MQKSNPFLELVFNLALPAILLSKLGEMTSLTPVPVLVISLSFPLLYGLYDFYKQKKLNFLSILGCVSVLLTGGFSILELDPFWIAVKEAGIPVAIGLVVLISTFTQTQVLRKFIFNESVLDVQQLNTALREMNNVDAFEKRLTQATYLFASTFFLSGFLNFALAKWMLVSPPGTPEFNKELGMMTGWSYPVIMIPCLLMMIFVLWFLFSGVKQLSGLEVSTLFKNQPGKGTGTNVMPRED